MEEEILNIVNENDEIIGVDTRNNIHENGLLHREIHVWLFNEKKELLFQKRSIDKDTYPGLLDISVAGHVCINEDHKISAIRELFEETGIKASFNDVVFLFKVRRNIKDILTNKINNTIQYIYIYNKYLSNLDNLIIEKGNIEKFEFWHIDQLLNFDNNQDNVFAPIFDDIYITILQKLKKLI